MDTEQNLNDMQLTTPADSETDFTPIILPPGKWLTYGEAIEKYNLTNSFLSTKRDKIRRQGRYYSEDDIIVAVNEPSYLARAKTRGQKNGKGVWPEGFITKANAIRKYKVGSSYLYARMKDGTISRNDQGLLDEADVIKVVNDPIYQARSAARKGKRKKTSSWTVKPHRRIVAKEQLKEQESHEPQERKDIEHYHAAYAAGWIASWIATYCSQSGDGLSARDVTRRVCRLLLGS